MLPILRKPAMLLCLIASMHTGSTAQAGMQYLITGDTAPVLRGKTVNAGFFEAQWDTSALTLVNIWATWCEPCRDEMPFLQKLSERYPGNRLRVLGVNVDEQEAAPITRFLAEIGADYMVILGGEKQGRLWGGIGVLPTTFLVDSRGRIAGRFKGGAPDTLERMTARIEALLSEIPEPVESE